MSLLYCLCACLTRVVWLKAVWGHMIRTTAPLTLHYVSLTTPNQSCAPGPRASTNAYVVRCFIYSPLDFTVRVIARKADSPVPTMLLRLDYAISTVRCHALVCNKSCHFAPWECADWTSIAAFTIDNTLYNLSCMLVWHLSSTEPGHSRATAGLNRGSKLPRSSISYWLLSSWLLVYTTSVLSYDESV